MEQAAHRALFRIENKIGLRRGFAADTMGMPSLAQVIASFPTPNKGNGCTEYPRILAE